MLAAIHTEVMTHHCFRRGRLRPRRHCRRKDYSAPAFAPLASIAHPLYTWHMSLVVLLHAHTRCILCKWHAAPTRRDLCTWHAPTRYPLYTWHLPLLVAATSTGCEGCAAMRLGMAVMWSLESVHSSWGGGRQQTKCVC